MDLVPPKAFKAVVGTSRRADSPLDKYDGVVGHHGADGPLDEHDSVIGHHSMDVSSAIGGMSGSEDEGVADAVDAHPGQGQVFFGRVRDNVVGEGGSADDTNTSIKDNANGPGGSGTVAAGSTGNNSAFAEVGSGEGVGRQGESDIVVDSRDGIDEQGERDICAVGSNVEVGASVDGTMSLKKIVSTPVTVLLLLLLFICNQYEENPVCNFK
mmetsp:Transcript_6814/g.14126  ORF Transcript_6814/g.14126 Transcript_6814/m.14126 type:complete len:212 (-) Transcript_6814:25-660(-)